MIYWYFNTRINLFNLFISRATSAKLRIVLVTFKEVLRVSGIFDRVAFVSFEIEGIFADPTLVKNTVSYVVT